MIIQIYEIQAPDEALLMARCGVDHIGGVVLSELEWKIPALKDSVGVIRESGRKSSIIPLFEDPDAVCRVIEWYQPDIVHFCGILNNGSAVDDHGVERAILLQSGVKKRFPNVEIMRTIPIAEPDYGAEIPTLELARRLEFASDWFLTDTMLVRGERQPVTGHVGITGKVCDWNIASDLVKQSDIPVILAGGLSADNVTAGILHTNPVGVDTCTATNLLDDAGRPIRFRKDPEKVRRFVSACR